MARPNDGPRLGIGHRGAGEVGQPVEERFVLGERDVVEERVAAVEEARDAAVGDVPGDLFGRIEIEAAVAVGLARQRRDGVNAPQVFESQSVASHVRNLSQGAGLSSEFYPYHRDRAHGGGWGSWAQAAGAGGTRMIRRYSRGSTAHGCSGVPFMPYVAHGQRAVECHRTGGKQGLVGETGRTHALHCRRCHAQRMRLQDDAVEVPA